MNLPGLQGIGYVNPATCLGGSGLSPYYERAMQNATGAPIAQDKKPAGLVENFDEVGQSMADTTIRNTMENNYKNWVRQQLELNTANKPAANITNITPYVIHALDMQSVTGGYTDDKLDPDVNFAGYEFTPNNNPEKILNAVEREGFQDGYQDSAGFKRDAYKRDPYWYQHQAAQKKKKTPPVVDTVTIADTVDDSAPIGEIIEVVDTPTSNAAVTGMAIVAILCILITLGLVITFFMQTKNIRPGVSFKDIETALGSDMSMYKYAFLDYIVYDWWKNF